MLALFCFKAELRVGKTWSFDVNTKLFLTKAVKFCNIDSRTFESQCTKRCPNLLNILVSGSTLAPRTEFYTAFSLHQENLCSSTYQVYPGNSQLLSDSQVEHLWTPSYSVFSINNFVAGSVNIFSCELVYVLGKIFECHLLKSSRYKNNSISFSK